MLEHVDTVLSFAVVMLLLSLLVTTVVQIVVAASALRSKILKRGIERLLKQVDPKLKDYAEQIADAVVCHPAVITEKSYPTAILEKLWLRITRRQTTAAREPCTTDIKKEELIRLLNDLAKRPTDALKGDAKEALAQFMGVAVLPEVQTLVDNMQAELIKAFSADAKVAKIKQIVEHVTESSRLVTANVTAWFDTVMDRTTDEFRQWTRWITIACAVVLPLVFHVDSLQIVRQLASDPELRARVMESADTTLNKAAEVFSLTEGSKSLASAAIQQACKDCPKIAAAYAIGNVPGDLAARGEGEKVLRDKLKDCKNPKDAEVFLAAYHKQFDKAADANLHGLLQRANEIKASLDESTLTIFAIGEPWGNYWAYWTDGMHILGMLMTVVFLSLGAPFWYNVLKQLSNLRPAIAQKVDLASELKE